jgi:hypothetical protein
MHKKVRKQCNKESGNAGIIMKERKTNYLAVTKNHAIDAFACISECYIV